MPTTWGALAGPATLWSDSGDVTFPPIMDGGDALTVVWLGLFDGGGATNTAGVVADAIAPRRTVWNTHPGP